MLHNYTLIDLLGAVEAAALFALFFLPPGFLAAYGAKLFRFRERSGAECLLWSVTLSTAISPILAVLVTRCFGLTFCTGFFLAMAAAALALLARMTQIRATFRERYVRIGLLLMAVWIVLALVTVPDWQTGDRLYVSYIAYDHGYRTLFVDAAARTGVPIKNPLFLLKSAPSLRYYYYWYVVCAMPVRMAGLQARAALNGSILWSGFAMAALIPLYLKYFCEAREKLRAQSLVGIGLLLVTGLDVIPFTLLSLRLGYLWGDMEWWNTNPVFSWVGSMIWVPHHLACLVACLIGFLLLSTLPEQAGWRERSIAALMAGAAFASAAGLSIYVTLVFAIFIVLWTLVVLVKNGPEAFFTWAASGAVCVVLSLPYLHELQAKSSVGRGLAFFAIRDYDPAYLWMKLHGITNLAALTALRFPTLLVMYAIEFGVFALVGWYRLRRDFRERSKLTLRQVAAWAMLLVCLVAVSVLASDSTGNNDLGERGILPVQFILLLWAAPLVSDLFSREGRARLGKGWTIALSSTLAIGLLSTAAQLMLLRVYAPVIDAGLATRTEPWIGRVPGFGRRSLELRRALDEMKAVTPRDAVLQYNPFTPDQNFLHLYTERQVTAGAEDCGAGFGGDEDECKQAIPYIRAVFTAPREVADWDLDRFCGVMHINLLMPANNDPAWRDPASWVWSRKALYAGDTLRTIPCGAQK
ncbi:MAG: hypothetical protein P4M01_03605 [Acidobacteriota bacterium]|nr:hypothetical protein [Acidobacteriota bacterium]